MNYSRPAYTGRPRAPGARGEGTALMHMLIDDLRHHRAPECHINVDEPDVDALRLYERLGFTNFESYGDTSAPPPPQTLVATQRPAPLAPPPARQGGECCATSVSCGAFPAAGRTDTFIAGIQGR